MTESKKTEDTKKVPSLAEITKKTEDTPEEKVEKTEKVEEVDHVDLPGYRDGVRLGAMPPSEAQLKQEEASSGDVHVWEESNVGASAQVYPGFTPQKMTSDQVGSQDE